MYTVTRRYEVIVYWYGNFEGREGKEEQRVYQGKNYDGEEKRKG